MLKTQLHFWFLLDFLRQSNLRAKNGLFQPVIANETDEKFTNNTFINQHFIQCQNNNRWHTRQKTQSPNDLKPSRLSNANMRIRQSSLVPEEPLF